MRSILFLAAGLVGAVAVQACSGRAQVRVEATTPQPRATVTVAVEPPPPPEPIAVRNASIEGTRIRIPHELEFGVDKATLDDNKQPNKDILGTLLEFMQKNSHVTKVRIEGHTDNTGKPDHNQTLSQQRADAVAKWLTDHGVDAKRIHAVGFGDSKPAAPNDTPEHRAQNRRTEFHVEEIDGKPHVPHHHHQADAAAAQSASAAPASSAAPSK